MKNFLKFSLAFDNRKLKKSRLQANKAITEKYDATTADRTISKAKIYFYYAKDKAVFCKEIVQDRKSVV